MKATNKKPVNWVKPANGLRETIVLGLLAKRSMLSLLAENTPQANGNSSNTGKERHVVGGLVAAQPVRAIPVSVGANHGMLVEDSPVEQIENIAT